MLILAICFYSTTSLLSLCIVRLLHSIFVLFILIGPFILNKKEDLLLYIIVSLFMMIHWIVSNDTCLLTVIEQCITGRKSDETFIGKIVKPVYNISNNQIKIISILLVLVAIVKYIRC